MDFGGGSLLLAVDLRIRCQIRCQREFGGGSLLLAVDSSFWRWIWRRIYPFGGGFGGGSQNPLPKVGGEEPLGLDSWILVFGEAVLAADLITLSTLST